MDSTPPSRQHAWESCRESSPDSRPRRLRQRMKSAEPAKFDAACPAFETVEELEPFKGQLQILDKGLQIAQLAFAQPSRLHMDLR